MNQNKKDKEQKNSLKSKNNDFSFIDKNNTNKFNNKDKSKLLKNNNSFNNKIKETKNNKNNKNLQKRLLKKEVKNTNNLNNQKTEKVNIVNNNYSNLKNEEVKGNNIKVIFDLKDEITNKNFNLKTEFKSKENFNKISKKDFNLKEHINIKDDFSNKLNENKKIESNDKFNIKDNIKNEYFKNSLKDDNSKLEELKNKNLKDDYDINYEENDKDKKLDFSNFRNSKSNLEEEKEPTINELKTDLKNLKIEVKKNKLNLEKSELKDKVKKTYTLQFREVKEVTDKNNSEPILKNKVIIPKLKEKGFQYNHSPIKRVNHRLNNKIRGKIHKEISKNEDDNTTVKATHFFEKNIERNLIYFNRSSNFRKIKKYNKLENKINNLQRKQTINNLKVQFKDSKPDYKKSVKNIRQKNLYKKMMMNKITKVNITKRVQNTVSNILAFKSSPLTFFLTLKGTLFGIVLFLIIFLMSFFSLIFSSINQGVDIYEIQKAELYYREMEAKVEYNNGKRINHNPIDLSSFLTTNFGDFVFDENMKKVLEELIKIQYLENKSLRQIIEETLTPEQLTYFLELHKNKGGYMYYGSPFQIEYEHYITSYIGYRINPTSNQQELQLHKGLDIGMAGGTPILAISDGIVTRANFSSSYGNIVEILHDDGYVSKYAHQQRLNVVKGQKVKQGDIIGFVGTTGDSTGNHLHLELYDNLGEFMNPIYFIARNNQDLGSDKNSK